MGYQLSETLTLIKTAFHEIVDDKLMNTSLTRYSILFDPNIVDFISLASISLAQQKF